MPYFRDPPQREVRIGNFVQYNKFRVDLNGAGYLAGEFPDGATTVGGVPVSAVVRVLLRTTGEGDGTLVAQVESAADGTWRVDGLDPAKKYDVVGRRALFNDVIVSNVSPSV